MNYKMIKVGNRKPAQVTLPVLGLACLLLSACSTTQRVAINQTDMNCPFLAGYCSMLTTGGKDQASLRYINPAAQWRQYNKVMIDPVTFWAGDTSRLSPSNQQTLVEFFSQQLNTQLGQKFEIVYQPGPGVMKVDVALTDAESATPVLRTISMLVPQPRALSTLKFLATGSFPFVGAAQAEARITDSISGEILAMAVDRKIGGGRITTGFQWRWGDAENIISARSEKMANRLSALTSGKAVPK